MTEHFCACVKWQVSRRSSMEPQDMYKLCYQAACGVEHMLQDEQKAWEYLQWEYDHVEESRICPLVEWLTHNVARVNLFAYKEMGCDLKILFDAFVESAKIFHKDERWLKIYLDATTQMAEDGELPFSKEAWLAFCKDRPAEPVHHSDAYKEKEKPSYRVVVGCEITKITDLLGS